MEQDECEPRVKEAFRAGRRAGIWLAFNGPRAQAQRRGLDVQAMRRQDRAMEGMADVFARAEQAEPAPRPRIILRRRPQIEQPEQAEPAPRPRIRLTPENASNYIGQTVYFTSGGQPQSATIIRVTPSGLAVQGGPPSIRNNLTFRGRVLMV